MAHLLIVVALALGVLVMHGLCHPADPAEPVGTGSTAQHATMAEGQQHMPSGPYEGAGLLAASDIHGAEPAPAASKPDPGRHDRPSHTMDMASLCLAVLSVWIMGLLFGGLLSRVRAWALSSLAAFVAGLRPKLPPPRAPDLLRLSVLRI
ncbi:hypothetical protein ACWIGX_28085 [Streptomyces nigrescens]